MDACSTIFPCGKNERERDETLSGDGVVVDSCCFRHRSLISHPNVPYSSTQFYGAVFHNFFLWSNDDDNDDDDDVPATPVLNRRMILDSSIRLSSPSWTSRLPGKRTH